ncbi:MAG: hypothetical protein AAGK05_19045, partial [Pseudomonadota bacterium]
MVSDIEYPSDAASTTFMLTVEAVNDAPVVVVEASAQQVTEGSVITLDASASHDLDNDELTFSWEGPGTIASPTSAITEVSGLTAGEHQFTVTVS